MEEEKKSGTSRPSQVSWNRHPGCTSMVRLGDIQLRVGAWQAMWNRTGCDRGGVAEINGALLIGYGLCSWRFSAFVCSTRFLRELLGSFPFPFSDICFIFGYGLRRTNACCGRMQEHNLQAGPRWKPAATCMSGWGNSATTEP